MYNVKYFLPLVFYQTVKIYKFHHYCFIEAVYKCTVHQQEGDLFVVIIWSRQSENHNKNVVFDEATEHKSQSSLL
jgi:hypothetical protein